MKKSILKHYKYVLFVACLLLACVWLCTCSIVGCHWILIGVYTWYTQDVCNNTEQYSKINEKQCSGYQCFVLLLEQQEIQNILKNGKAIDVLFKLIEYDKPACIEYVFLCFSVLVFIFFMFVDI